jgi:class 3 adenylate cyclase/esterase/lipase
MIGPETHFATAGGDRVAYQVMGDGPRDIVCTYGQWGHVDLDWDDPNLARFLKRLASFGRLIRFNMRGTGLSDPRPHDGREVWEHWAEDLLAVMDATGSRASAIVGWADAGVLALPFAAKYPERVSALVLFNTSARYSVAPDYPEGLPSEVGQQLIEFVRRTWGTDEYALAIMPSLRGDAQGLRSINRILRAMATPKAVAEGFANFLNCDARTALAAIRAPTLVMARDNYEFLPVRHGKYLAEHIANARFVQLPGTDFGPYSQAPDEILDQIEEFLTGVRHGGEPERALLSVLFTDIVDSTKRAAELGDTAWRALLDRHDKIQHEQIGLFKGRLIDSAGDGTFVTFDRPDRAVQCAQALVRELGGAGLRVRAGVHFGDVELREDGRVGGLTVHVGARVAQLAAPTEVLVSRTVRDILMGSRFTFEERGVHQLKGLPGEWSVYAVREKPEPLGTQPRVPADGPRAARSARG